jgi:hypothetical protein
MFPAVCLGHYRMRGEFAVLSAEDWEAWMRTEQRLLR